MRKIAIVILLLILGAAWALQGSRAQFILGGALINAGYRLQDPLTPYDFANPEATALQIWDEFIHHNQLAATVRSRWPRTARHPVVALVACMDGRLDSNEIAGDTRRYYYVVRLAGSVLSAKEEEMLELAVANGVKVVVFTTHSDCAAEKAAADPATRAAFPNLSAAVDERQARFDEFLARPRIQKEIAAQALVVKWMDLDTLTERVTPHLTSR
ncbi:MAG: carbonic anhydrase [Bryobacteraceae bacterium]